MNLNFLNYKSKDSSDSRSTFSEFAEESKPKTSNIARAFRKFIRRKIEQEYERNFKQMLSDAKQNYESSKKDAYTQKANMRELTGLKVGLEFIKQQ